MSSITFTGDIGFDKYMDGKWRDEHFLADDVREFLLSADHLCVNVEGPLCTPKKKFSEEGAERLLHSINPEAVVFLDDIKADIWNICNNHIMDSGPEGLEETLRMAASRDVLTVGAGMNINEASGPVILNEAGGIGIIGVGYQRACRKADESTPGCFSWSDLELIREKISQIKKKCRWCIVVAHAGEEFTSLPMTYTRRRYLDFLDMGADIIIGHHPHVPMNYEKVGDKMIFYSLGNFVFDTDYQRSQHNTQFGVFVRLDFTQKEYSYKPFGIRINREKGIIESCGLPAIFTDVNEEEYNRLLPLSAKAFLEATKRQLKYLYPDKFAAATEEDFMKDFMQVPRSGRVEGETLDFHLILPIAESLDMKVVEESKLQGVVEYIMGQMVTIHSPA